jgi:hypothetical protein
VVAGWRRGDPPGLRLGELIAEEALALERSVRKRLGCQPGGSVVTGQTSRVDWCPGQFPEEPGLVSELCPKRLGEHPDPGRVACDLRFASPSNMTPISEVLVVAPPRAAATRSS